MNINIFGKIYKVFKTKERPDGNSADVNHKTKVIRIYDNKNQQFFDECLIHEVIHGAWDRIGIGCTKLPPDLEEVLIDSAAKVISENFRLVKK